MEPTQDFSLTENELRKLQQIIEQARATKPLPPLPTNHKPHTAKRLLSELRGLSATALEPSNQGSPDFPFSILPLHDSNIREFIAKFPGPSSTPYEGGIFHLRLSVPDGYPTAAVRVWFCTKTYHPNVQPNGEICAHGFGVGWNASWHLRTVVLAVASMLSAPDLTDPSLGEVARVYLTDRGAFEKTAREWAARYAVGELVFPGERADGFCNTMAGVL